MGRDSCVNMKIGSSSVRRPASFCRMFGPASSVELMILPFFFRTERQTREEREREGNGGGGGGAGGGEKRGCGFLLSWPSDGSTPSICLLVPSLLCGCFCTRGLYRVH